MVQQKQQPPEGEGEWKNFRFHKITESNKSKVYDHLKQFFYEDELVFSQYGRSTEECAKDCEKVYDNVIPQGLSLLAEDKATGEIAGVVIIMKDLDIAKLKFEFQSPQVINLVKIFGSLDNGKHLKDGHAVNEVATLVAASTSRKNREQGLSKELFRRSLELLKTKGIKYVKTVSTTPFARKALGHVGFRELARIHFKGYQDGMEQALFPNLPDGLFANFMCIKL